LPAKPAGDLAARLRTDRAVAWSPDGTRIAFVDGGCYAIYDDCLSVGDLASGAEQVIAAYGGGGPPGCSGSTSPPAPGPAWSPARHRAWRGRFMSDRIRRSFSR
jgi:hypothetical protein